MRAGAHSDAPTTFINQTHHGDAKLLAIWRAAQQNLSHEIDLNPLEQVFTGAAPRILPGDSPVWNVSPRRLVVASQADVSSSEFYVLCCYRR